MDIAALVISGISLVLAVISFDISVKSQNIQNEVNEIVLKLKKYELDEKEKQAYRKAYHKNLYMGFGNVFLYFHF